MEDYRCYSLSEGEEEQTPQRSAARHRHRRGEAGDQRKGSGGRGAGGGAGGAKVREGSPGGGQEGTWLLDRGCHSGRPGTPAGESEEREEARELTMRTDTKGTEGSMRRLLVPKMRRMT